MTGGRQKLYEKWREDSSGSEFSNAFPYVLKLGVDQFGHSLLPFYPDTTSKIISSSPSHTMTHSTACCVSAIVGRLQERYSLGSPASVRPYDETPTMRQLTCALNLQEKYLPEVLLARLISTRQVVLLHSAPTTHLFYHGKVDSRSRDPGFGDLPIHQAQGIQNRRIWAFNSTYPICNTNTE